MKEQAIVKHRYIAPRRAPGRSMKAARLVAVDKSLAHLKYIQHRPGEDREKGGRELFTDDRDNVQSAEMRKAIRQMDKSNVTIHKLTLSPEVTPDDPKAYTREVMAKIGSEKGLDLDWFAVQHRNTDHPHIHIVVLGKDKNGRAVTFKKDDYPKLRAYSDQHLERVKPLEMQKARRVRELKEKQRLAELTKAREERIRDGLELPFMKRMIIREQLEPHSDWKKKRDAQERQDAKPREDERPYHQDTIDAAGKSYSKDNSLEELKELNKFLWDNYDERLPLDEYKKLVAWMKEKENHRAGRIAGDKQISENAEGKEIKSIEYKGARYSEKSSFEKLQGLAAQLREKDSDRLPVEEYNKLRGWLEGADRARWAGAFEREMESVDKKFYRSKSMEDLKAAEGGRVINPLQENMMNSPVMGLFMKGAAVANMLVRAIPLTDQRDRLQEGREALESAKLEKSDDHNRAGRSEEQKADDRETIEKLDKALDQNKASREERADEKKRKKWERENEEDPFLYDPWGRY